MLLLLLKKLLRWGREVVTKLMGKKSESPGDQIAPAILLDNSALDLHLLPGRSESSFFLEHVTVHSRALSQPSREEKVRALAYDLWLQRGSPEDCSSEKDWLEAERLVPN